MSTKVKTAMDNAQDMIDAGVDTAQRAVAVLTLVLIEISCD